MRGKLYLIPTPLGDDETAFSALPNALQVVVHQIDTFIVEQSKPARRFLKTMATAAPLQALALYELNEHTVVTDAMFAEWLAPIEAGKNVGLLSDAGCPAVADPGATAVAYAHRKGIQVVPLVGPSSILLALMASGMNGQQFAFLGYLPAKTPERIKAIKAAEQLALRSGQTQIFIETPYRNAALLHDLLQQLPSSTKLCVAIDITLATEQIATKTVADWRKIDLTVWTRKAPAVFVIGL